MDYLVSLRLFVRVAKLGSFSRAAEAHDLKTSSVSRSIAALEKDLGVMLFRRSTRHVQLTNAGTAFYDRATEVLSVLDEARSFAGSLAEKPIGALTVRAPIEFGRRYLLPVLNNYLAANPGVRIKLTMSIESSDAHSMETDLTIHVGELRDSRYFARQLASNRHFIVASPVYIERTGPVKHPVDLASRNCLLSANETEWHFRSATSTVEDRVSLSGTLVSSEREALLYAAVAGLGIACLPGWLAGEEIRSGGLVVLLQNFDPSPPNSAVYALSPERLSTLPKVTSFLQAVESEIDKRALRDRF